MRTTDEVASAAEFLLGPEGSIITGADLRMDGGDIAALRAGRLQVNVSRKDGQRQQMTRVVATSLKNRA